MIKKKSLESQVPIWIFTNELQVQPQISFYSKLNEILDKMKFAKKVHKLTKEYYSSKKNVRPPVDPVVYFKMLMIGFFENIRSGRGIASRCADSISIRSFLGYELTESTPDHSTLSIIGKRLPEKIYSQVFTIVLEELKKEGLVKGKNISLDSSVIEANASLKSLKNRFTSEDYSSYVKELAKADGVDISDPAAVARYDRKRKDRKTSNEEWENPYDKDAKIGKTKAGATDMIYKPEHTVDLDTGAIIDANLLLGDSGDAEGESERIMNAQIRLLDISENPVEATLIETVSNDKGYFKLEEVLAIQNQDIEANIPDKQINRNKEKLTDEETLALELAKSSTKSKEGKALLKRRGMYVERSFAHVLDSGGFRRTYLKGQEKNQKRYYIATACYNLSLLMRTIFGVGTPKQAFAGLIFNLFSIYKLISPLACKANHTKNSFPIKYYTIKQKNLTQTQFLPQISTFCA